MQLAAALAGRDSSNARVTEVSQKFTEVPREMDTLLQQQLDDAAQQLKTLLRKLGLMHDSTLPSDEDMQGVKAKALHPSATPPIRSGSQGQFPRGRT